MSSDPLTLSKGRLLGRYELLAPVAKGGMGQVWVGRLRGARGFHKLVAVKTLLSAGGNDERMERMLLEEARIASLIQHSNVVQTMELGEHDGTLYLVMEWVDGDPLSHLLTCAARASGIPLDVAVNLVAQTLRGLQAAHELCDDTGTALGVVHRDVSPHNVLVSYSGVAKLVDFGIAKAMNQLSSSTGTGEIKGKFAYMAPEQILGGEIDQRADIFAVGIMLYLLTVGRHPFKNHNSAGVLHSITSEEPAVRPSVWNAQYSPALEAIVLRALDKDRAGRWPSAEEMRLALEAAVPEAFALGIEARIRSFITDTVGDRAARKREALRRAIVAADAQLKDSGSLPALGAGQSAGSLRAVSVDESAVVSAESEPRLSRMPTARPPSEAAFLPVQRPRRVWLMGAFAAIALALGVASLHGRRSARALAGSPSTGMTELVAPSGARLLAPEPRTAPKVVVTPIASVPASASAASSALPLRPATGTSPARKTATPHLGPKKPSASGSDLIAPDYAR